MKYLYGCILGVLLLSCCNRFSDDESIFTKDPDFDAIIVDTENRVFPVNQILILMEEGASQSQLNNLASKLGATIVGQVPVLDIYQIELPTTTVEELDAACARARELSGVASVSYNLFGGLDESCPAVCDINKNLTTYEDRCPWQDINYFQALTVFENLRSELQLHDVRVAVIDTGLDATLSEFDSMSFTNKITNVLDPTKPVVDHGAAPNFPKPYHGTKVCGVIAAEDDGKGMNGIAFRFLEEKLHLLVGAAAYPDAAGNWDLTVVSSRVIEAATKAVKNHSADVVNMGLSFNLDAKPQAAAVRRMFERLFRKFEKDALFVVSAGNNGVKLTATNRAPAGMQHPNVMTVAASNECDPAEVATFSNYGENRVNIVVPGRNITVVDPQEPNLLGRTSGTSYAAPLVTSLAAILKSLNPDLSPNEVKNYIEGSPIGNAILGARDRDQALYTRLNLYLSLAYFLIDFNPSATVVDAIQEPNMLGPRLVSEVLNKMCGKISFTVGSYGAYEITFDEILDQPLGSGTYVNLGGTLALGFDLEGGMSLALFTSDTFDVGVQMALTGIALSLGGECEPLGYGQEGEIILNECWIDEMDPLTGRDPMFMTLEGEFVGVVHMYNDPCGDITDITTEEIHGTFDTFCSNDSYLQDEVINLELLTQCIQGRRPK